MSNETNEHKNLKAKAGQFLDSIGCQDIQEEYRLPKIQFTFGKRPRHWKTREYLIFDVVGFKDGRLIAIECGSVVPRKLSSIIHQGILLYILPFGKNKPYLWHKDIKVCKLCGNKV